MVIVLSSLEGKAFDQRFFGTTPNMAPPSTQIVPLGITAYSKFPKFCISKTSYELDFKKKKKLIQYSKILP
jgi:hypothetical protein